MATWPTSPTWSDVSGVNKGNEYAGGDGIYYSDLNIIVNNLEYLHKDAAAGGYLNQIYSWINGTVSGVTYDTTNGAKVIQITTVQYRDSTDDSIKQTQFYTTTTLPIVSGKYIYINPRNKKMVVNVDDTALALDYIKIDKTRNSVIPEFYNGKIQWDTLTVGLGPSSVVQRDANNATYLGKLYVNRFATTAGEYDMPLQAAYYGGFSDGFTVEKTPTDTGTLTAVIMDAIQAYPNAGLKYDNQSYVRMDPQNAPDGTLNFIHIDSIDDGNGGYKATGKCFSITVSNRAWHVFDLDFGGSSRTTHNLTLTYSSTGMSIYFSLTNNRTETYESAPTGLWSALENSPIACTVDDNGSYSAGMITVDGDNFKVFYGNSEEALIEQMQVSITDSMV